MDACALPAAFGALDFAQRDAALGDLCAPDLETRAFARVGGGAVFFLFTVGLGWLVAVAAIAICCCRSCRRRQFLVGRDVFRHPGEHDAGELASADEKLELGDAGRDDKAEAVPPTLLAVTSEKRPLLTTAASDDSLASSCRDQPLSRPVTEPPSVE